MVSFFWFSLRNTRSACGVLEWPTSTLEQVHRDQVVSRRWRQHAPGWLSRYSMAERRWKGVLPKHAKPNMLKNGAAKSRALDYYGPRFNAVWYWLARTSTTRVDPNKNHGSWHIVWDDGTLWSRHSPFPRHRQKPPGRGLQQQQRKGVFMTTPANPNNEWYGGVCSINYVEDSWLASEHSLDSS